MSESTPKNIESPHEPSLRVPRPVVWVLDDSPLEAAMARKALLPSCDVEVFSDGSVLIERIAAGPGPAALVLDWQLPGMSGIEVCRFLRSIRDETALPILMLTVYGHKGDLVEGLEAGANDYVTKPYNAPELAARVATLVRVKTLYEAMQRSEEAVSRLLEVERATRAEAEAANAAKDTFLAMVSHELRTPLNAILGWSKMARSGTLPLSQQARALETIERNATSQVQLVEDLLDMTRIVGGKLAIATEVVDLVRLVREAMETLVPTAAAREVRVESTLVPKVALVLGDNGRLRQVVWNLLTNALKFTTAGGRVQVELVIFQGQVELTIADSGVGIDAEFLPRVFDRFRQAESGTARAHGGLGLGLAIVKHIVDLHRGRVSAESAGLGRGATFRVTLPAVSDVGATRSEPSVRDVSSVARSARLDGVRVLVVDDDDDALDLMQIVLEEHGASVTIARATAEAFEVVRAKSVDVIVSDVGMPHEDGHKFMGRVRKLPFEQGGKTPSVALTAFAHSQDRAVALAAGFDAYVSKPVDLERLLVTLEDLVTPRSQSR